MNWREVIYDVTHGPGTWARDKARKERFRELLAAETRATRLEKAIRDALDVANRPIRADQSPAIAEVASVVLMEDILEHALEPHQSIAAEDNAGCYQ